MSGFDESFNRILDLSQNNKMITFFVEESRNLYNRLLSESGSTDSDGIPRAKRLLDVAVLIYVTEKEVCNNMDTTYGEYGRKGSSDPSEIDERTFCHANMRRVLESIKRYTEKGSLTLDTNLATAIRDAIMTCNYYTKPTQSVPDVFTKLAELKQSNESLFEKYVDEILEVEVNPENQLEFKIVLHSGFKKRVLGIRPGPSPKSNDTDGLFICNLGIQIAAFLQYYNIKYTESKRYDELNRQCRNALLELIPHSNTLSPIKKIGLPNAPPPSSLMLPGPEYNKYLSVSNQATASLAKGGRSSRRRKVYKTTRRNNKNKNKKHYKRKRHTKKYKKSHRKSRR